MVMALADVLPDFGAPPRPARPPVHAQARSAAPAAPQPDLGSLIAEAVATAEAALEAKLTHAHEAALAEEHAAHAAEIERLTQQFGNAMGTAVAERVAAAERELTALVTGSVARLMAHLLGEDLMKRSLEALADTVSGALRDREGVRMRVSGPPGMFEAFRATLPVSGINIDFQEAPGFDLTVDIGGTLFETRLSQWASALSEAIE